MEILKVGNAFFSTAAIIGVVSFIALLGGGAFIASDEDDTVLERVGHVMMVLSIVALCAGIVIGSIGVNSYKKYTIEITNPHAYQYLIEHNYSIIERPYDSKNIYVIQGDPLPTEWETDW